MTEFTFVGNLKKVSDEGSFFTLNEGRNEYVVFANRRSEVTKELKNVRPDSKIRVNGIITKDSETGENIFVCNKVNVIIGKDDTK